METILQIQNHVYPFEAEVDIGEVVKVKNIQAFSSLKDLHEKRGEMQVKSRLVDSPYIIRLLKIYQDDLTLHYLYEHVPYSLGRYVQTNFLQGRQEVAQMSGRLFSRKLSSELMMLISFLVQMKIEVDLSVENLGFTRDDKLKLFMSYKCRMGHKTEVSLIAHYNSCKERVLYFLQKLFNTNRVKKHGQTPGFIIKGNKLVFPTVPLNQSVYQSQYQPQSEQSYSIPNSCDTGMFSSYLDKNSPNRKNSTSSCINYPSHEPSFLRQTQLPLYGRASNYSQAKFSTRSSRKPKKHKNSFQFGANTPRADRYTSSNYSNKQDKEDAKSFTHSRSMKIEIEQKVDPSQRKKRKDSYKVKVTSFHQYELDDCDPRDIFKNNEEEQGGDIFQQFTKKAQNFSKRKQHTEENQSYDRFEDEFEEPPFLKKESMPQEGYAPTMVSSARNLEQKVRQAKEKASNILNRYMKAKKMSSYGQ